VEQVLMSNLKKLEHGQVLLVPHGISGAPILFVIEKTGEETADFIVVNTDPELLHNHPAAGKPPKIKYQTCLVLEGVPFDRVKDEAFWALAYWVAQARPDVGHYNLEPAQVLYEILLPFLQGQSLDEIRHKQHTLRKEGAQGKQGAGGAAAEDGDAEENPHLRSPQRSETGHLRCLIEALQCLMRRRGLALATRKEVSLLLRLEMLELVMHDMAFVTQLSTAERTLLHIACRQISYSTSKLGLMLNPDKSEVLSLEQATAVTAAIESLRDVMAHLPCGDSSAAVAPPPLVLCEAESDRLNPSLRTLLGTTLVSQPSACNYYKVLGVANEADEEDVARAYKKAALRHHPDKNPGDPAGAEERFKAVQEAYEGIKEGRTGKLEAVECEAALAEAQVVGIYFSASWCGPCRQATPVLAETYKQIRKKHGAAFEIVCVSHDQNEAAFQRYFQKMPWLALPFHTLQKTVLGELFQVEGIPTLVLVDSNGKVISRDGLRLLSRHPKAFPWNVKTPDQVPRQHTRTHAHTSDTLT
jgi:thiol-disulfide isomerase/thioredoxin